MQGSIHTQRYGFYIHEKNANTFLYASLQRNNLLNAIHYFFDKTQGRYYEKWLYPIYADIFLFDQYQHTLAEVHAEVEANHAYYFFDLCIEDIPYYPIDGFLSQKFKSFHQMLKQNQIDPSRVFFVHANLVGDKYYDDWCNKIGVDYKIGNKPLTHQYSLGGFSDSFKRYFEHDHLLERHVELAERSMHERLKRKYYFTCLMLRPRYHRTVIMLHLLERNYLEKGIVSYFGSAFGHQSTVTVEAERETYQRISELPSGKRLLSVWDPLLKMGSVMVDQTLNVIKENGWAPQDLGFFPRTFIEDTSSLNTRSYFEVVVETHFTDESSLYVTEKTMWAIVSLQPFLIVGSPHTLRYLRELGFQTFSPYINESYDAISNPNERMECILHEIDRLCSLSQDDIHDLYSALWSRVLHNYEHYFKRSKEIAVREIQKRIVDPINQTKG